VHTPQKNLKHSLPLQPSITFVCFDGLCFYPKTSMIDWTLNVRNQLINQPIGLFLILCAGKNFLRPNQMNINVATWGRLMKRALPQNGTDTDMSMPQDKITSPGRAFHHL